MAFQEETQTDFPEEIRRNSHTTMNSLPVANETEEHNRIGRENSVMTILLGLTSWVFLCSLTIADPDLWGHTIYGMRAIEQGMLLERTDPFSYTALGDPWLNHEWAVEYEYGWLWKHWGNAGLLFWKYGLLAFLVGWLTWRMQQTDSNLGARLLLFVFLTMCLGNFAVYIRPQIVTFVLFPVYLWLLHRSWDRWTPWMWMLPVLTVVWVNHHGGFLAGVAMIGFYTCLHWARFILKGENRADAIRLSLVLIGSILATFVNPYGYHLHSMLWIHLGTEQPVREWQAVWAVGFSWVYLTPFLILALAFLPHRRWRWIDFLVLLIIALQAAMHLRHIALLCLAEMVLLPVILSESLRRLFPNICQRWVAPESSRLRYLGVGMTVGFLALLQIQSAIPIWKEGLPPWQIVVETKDHVPGMPTRAVRFLKDQKIDGNLLTDYGWGQFVIWHLYPETKVGFDGRYRTVYSPEIEADLLAFRNAGQESPSETPFLDQHPTEILLLPANDASMDYVQEREDWLEIYRDPQASIFVKEGFLSETDFSQTQRFLTEFDGPTWEKFPGVSKTGTKIAY